jgi:hypothetical protein
MRLFKQADLSIYLKCDELPIWNFYQLLKTNDFNYLLKKNSRKIKESDTENLNKLYFDLFNEYVELSKNESVISLLKKRAKINILNMRALVCTLSIDYIIQDIDKEFYIDILKKQGISFDLNKDFQTEIQNSIQWVKAFKQEIKELEFELNEKTTQEEKSVESQAISISRSLNLAYRLNTKEITVTEWLSLIEQTKEQSNGKRD